MLFKKNLKRSESLIFINNMTMAKLKEAIIAGILSFITLFLSVLILNIFA